MSEAMNNETRWDERKAGTIAAAMQQLGTVDEVLGLRNASITRSAELALYRKDWEDGYPDFGGYYGDSESEFHELYDTKLRQSIEQGNEMVNGLINLRMVPFVNLYDRNPAAAADMPTEEFVEAAQQDQSLWLY